MSRGRLRRPVLAVAAAAVMLAVTPAAATRTAPPGPAVQAEPRHSDPSPDGPYLTVTDGPVLIAELTEDGERWSVLAFLERYPEGTGWVHRACVAAVPPGAPPNDPTRHPRSAGCAGMSDWPADAPPSKVHARSPLRADIPGGGPLPGLLLFTTAPEVSRLDVRGAYGEPAKVTQLARTADLALYLADFSASSVGFGYTAWDASGAVIETGIS